MTPNEPSLTPPEPLTDAHEVADFDCGEPTLNIWLQRRALANQASGASRTFVVCREQHAVGYYALAAGGIASTEAPGRARRNMPDPIPMMVLGRLAVDRRGQGQGLGVLLLRDAVARTQRVAVEFGIAGIVVHAISEEAKRFYQRWGFVEAPNHPMTLIARLKDIGE